MKKLIPLIILLLIFNSCNKKTETKITLISNNTNWVGFEGFYLEKELILCGIQDVAQIELTEKLNDNDTIYNGLDETDNRFIYATRPTKVGRFEIKGNVIINGQKKEFSQSITILPKAQPIGFKKENATELKVGVENEIEIVIGIPKKYRTLTTDNGKIIERESKTIIIPERVGQCQIEIKVELPSDEKMEFNNVIFNVSE